ncbi:ubiquitin carboxyl-terminal hydrolase 17-like protein [Tanacetum coccineum]
MKAKDGNSPLSLIRLLTYIENIGSNLGHGKEEDAHEFLKVICMKRGVKSERHERIVDLTLEIEGDMGTLEEALDTFTCTEVLDGENKFKCSSDLECLMLSLNEPIAELNMIYVTKTKGNVVPMQRFLGSSNLSVSTQSSIYNESARMQAQGQDDLRFEGLTKDSYDF